MPLKIPNHHDILKETAVRRRFGYNRYLGQKKSDVNGTSISSSKKHEGHENN